MAAGCESIPQARRQAVYMGTAGASHCRVSAGDKVVVRTERGARTVIVTAVEEYAGNEPEPLRMVIRAKRAAQHGK